MIRSSKLDRHPPPAEIRRFGLRTSLTTPIAALVWFGLIRMTSGVWHWALPGAILAIGLTIGLACVAFPRATRLLHVGWHALIATTDWLVVSLALILVYFLVFTPLGLLLRLLGRCPLRRRPDAGQITYWRPAEKVTDLRQYHRQF